MLITPVKGSSISRMRKIDAETDSPHTSNAPITVAFRGANNPKLPNSTVSQQTITMMNTIGTERWEPLNTIQRVCRISLASSSARA